MAQDKYGCSVGVGLGASPDAAVITPDDASVLHYLTTRGIYVGSAGDLRVRTEGGTDVTFKGVAGGTVVLIRAEQVMRTGTTAGDLVALY